ncbi:transglutaminase family protein [Paroceanicella profunda]|uniref:Transglutaminase family protein n=1 Tax=Paroceanicella profunda TaxID=2579971 RepID=A0A5B8FIB3_9RHOB|nr:transglutaminase family protein [Paroceanicella profunda]QDL92908.1 transglutaminase family protein [Paroceanicella profunda]
MLYDLRMTITYEYEAPVAGGRHMVRVLPLNIPGLQRLIAGSVTVNPAPAEREESTDFYGNTTSSISFREAHDTLVIGMQARVQVEARDSGWDLSGAPAGLAAELAAITSLGPDSPHHFLSSSPRVVLDRTIAAYARETLVPGTSVIETVRQLTRRIHTDFTYDPEATKVDTTPRQAFDQKRGVCQDFTHVMISALRSLGIPAAYVSGYLRTEPPAGQERLEGADAMHAWVRAWCGDAAGWIGFDPTNDMLTGTDHITVGHGRDYADVAPVIGVLRTFGGHKTTQAVDVIPVKNVMPAA